jgi:hypothetical protein
MERPAVGFQLVVAEAGSHLARAIIEQGIKTLQIGARHALQSGVSRLIALLMADR